MNSRFKTELENNEYRLAGRKTHPDSSVFNIGNAKFGDGFTIIAGPCAVENRAQIISTAHAVKAAGAAILRGGAFKPRTSPYDFQGLREEGLKLLLEAKRETGLPVASEILSIEHIGLFDDIDLLQIGARNMQNYELLKEVGRLGKPVLLKRGWSNTISELLMAAEYLMSGGADRIILCERGIRTFETSMRNTLDLGAVAVLKKYSHLPIIVDPSHAAGNSDYVEPLALAAAAAGADGLMVEVHPDPMCALSDGAQALTPLHFEKLAKQAFAISDLLLGR